jgi:diaminopimelate epimerase
LNPSTETLAKLPFWKLQSVGNDFPLVHLADVRALAPEALEDRLPRLAVAICDRHFGVGGDGLLAVEMEGDALRLRMFNPDGTEDFCGNGIRCAYLHAREEGWVGSSVVLRHLDREVQVESGEEGWIRSDLGAASYDPGDVPHTAFGELFNTTIWSGVDGGQPLSLFGSALTTGSTHTVIPTDALPDDESFASVSAKIEVLPLFPKRTSVIWRREVAEDELEIRIWERGVGETLGCGTGASAAAADYLRRKGRGGRVRVRSRGGEVWIRADRSLATISVEGRAETVYRGTYFWETSGS